MFRNTLKSRLPCAGLVLLVLGLVLAALAAPGGAAPGEELVLTGRPASAAFVAEQTGDPASGSLAPGRSGTFGGRTVRNLDLPELPVRLLAFSDHPERVEHRGLLFQAGLLRFQPVRFQYYHEGGRRDGPLFLSLRVWNLGRRPARVHALQGAAGPDPDYFSAGHRNNQVFLRRLAAFEGTVTTLAPGEVRSLALHALLPEQVVSGTVQMTLLEGDQVDYGLFAVHDPGEPLGFDLQSKVGDVHARGIYPSADQDLLRGWEVGPEEGYVALGAVRQPNLVAGPELKGDYGVVYRIRLRVSNPGPRDERVEFLLNPRGGAATGNFLLQEEGGRLQEWRASRPIPAFEKAPLGVLDVPAGGERRVTLWSMPEGASNYPVRIVLRRAPAAPPSGRGEERARAAGREAPDHDHGW